MDGIHKVLILILILILTLVGMYVYYGGFHDIELSIARSGGETMVYEELKGDYSQTVPVANKMHRLLADNEKIVPSKTLGIFYDDPQRIPKKKRQHFEAGCIVENLDSLQLKTLKEKYKVKVLPTCNYITAEFPLKGFISHLIGIMKVYPEIEDYLDDNRIRTYQSITHIFDAENEKIIYRLQLPE